MISVTLAGKENKPPIDFFEIEEMADKCKRSKYTFYRLIERGIMPDANFRTPDRVIQRGVKRGKKLKGSRLYSSEFLAPKLISFFKGVKQGRTITHEQREELIKMFLEEKKFYEKY